MNRRAQHTTQLSLALACLIACQLTKLRAETYSFDVSFTQDVRSTPYSGRVYLFFGKDSHEPRLGPDWFHPDPFVSLDVTDWQPGETLNISTDDSQLLTFPRRDFPKSLQNLTVQAVARFNDWERRIGDGPGNGFSKPIKIDQSESPVKLAINQLVQEQPFEETIWGKLLQVESKILSDFHQRKVNLRATIQLPSSYYDHPDRRYPVIFSIPGFGGDHRHVAGPGTIDPIREPIPETNKQGVEFIRVFLDPNCPWGHHVFADSATNGPCGTALVREFLPALDTHFRTIPQSTARFLTGHSSGGWSSLWVQISHPKEFGGVWSTAPDPVDFHDFQQIDIYRDGENMWVDREGEPRPLARMDGEVVVNYRAFDEMERVLGHGGQLQSFEAVFSPRGDDGQPRPLWNRDDGSIDTHTANAWRKYDINHQLQQNWTSLQPDLAGKLHVIMGDADTFYLEGAVRNLKTAMAEQNSDADIQLVPGKTHFDLLTSELLQQIRREMTTQFLSAHPQWPRNN